MKWEVDKVKNKLIVIKLAFTDKTLVSNGRIFDSLILQLNPGETMFLDKDMVQIKPFEREIEIPPQTEETLLEDPEDTGNIFLNTLWSILSVKFVALFIITTSLERFKSLVNIMQILTVISLF